MVEALDIEKLRERYEVRPVPPCRVCGAPLQLSSAGGGSLPKYNCSAVGVDMSEAARSHYYNSEHFHDHGDGNVIAAIAHIEALEKSLVSVIGIPAVRQILGTNHTARCRCPICRSNALIGRQKP